jgi:putative flippase GtrA
VSAGRQRQVSAGRQESTARELYARFRDLIHEGARFGVVGMIGFAISLGGANVLRFDVGLEKYTSVTIATGIATLATFIGNRHWTFRHRERTGTARETVMFFALNGVGLLIQYACIGIIQDALGWPGKLWYNVANLIGIGLGTLFRFWSYRTWVWGVATG